MKTMEIMVRTMRRSRTKPQTNTEITGSIKFRLYEHPWKHMVITQTLLLKISSNTF